MRTIPDNKFLPTDKPPVYGSMGYLRINLCGYFVSESVFRTAIKIGDGTVEIKVPEGSDWMPMYNAGREPNRFRRFVLKLRMIWKIIKTT